MGIKNLLSRVVYLDKAFIADRYEAVHGISSQTVITSSQGGKAGTSIPFFSAEVNALEARSFPLSTMKMLADVWDDLQADGTLDSGDCRPGMKSRYGWVTGELTVFKSRATSMDETIASSEHFRLRMPKPGLDFALITTQEYFATGLGALLKMQDTLLTEMSIPVQAYLRVVAARDLIGQWVAAPLAMVESLD